MSAFARKAVVIFILFLLAACGKTEPTATPLPPAPSPAMTMSPTLTLTTTSTPLPQAPPPSPSPALTMSPALTPALAPEAATPESAPPPASGLIAFVSTRDGNGEIYVMQADGNAPRRLTNWRQWDGYPSWSPDGRQIAYYSYVSSQDWVLKVINVEGGEARQLTDNGACNGAPHWSPDGALIAYNADADCSAQRREIYVIDADGGDPRNLTQNDADDMGGSWSPDSQQIVFASDRDGNYELYVLDVRSEETRRLTDNLAQDMMASWSPDGRQIAFVSDRDGNDEIYLLDVKDALQSADGENLRRLTDNPGADWFPCWSPDGRQLVFNSRRDGNLEIYTLDVASGAVRRLTDDPADDFNAVWQPAPVQAATWTYQGELEGTALDALQTDDGGYLLLGATNYSHQETAREDIHLAKIDPSGAITWQKSFGGDKYDRGTALAPASDGGWIILGETESLGAGDRDVYLLKVDQQGNELWSTTFGGSGAERANALQPTSDGGYILIGSTRSFEALGEDVYLLRTDAAGNALWSRAFGGEEHQQGYAVYQTPDGGFLALFQTLHGDGPYPEQDPDTHLLKTDGDGNAIWTRAWDGPGVQGGSAMLPTSAGGYVITGVFSPAGTPAETPDGMDIMFLEVDADGNTLWERPTGSENELDYGAALLETDDGHYLLGGMYAHGGVGAISLLKASQDGDVVWSRRLLQGQGNKVALKLFQASDGGYVLVAQTDEGGRGFETILIKTDSAGNVGDAAILRQAQDEAATLTPEPEQATVSASVASLESLPIEQFFEQSHVLLQLRDPDTLILNGQDQEYGVARYERPSDMSPAYVRETRQLEVAVLDLLRTYDRAALAPEQQLSYDIYEWYLEDLLRGHEFARYRYPLNPAGMWSMHVTFVSVMENTPIASKSDAEDYVARLSGTDAWVEQLLEGLELSREAGVIPPQFVVQGTIPQVEMYTALDPTASSLYSSFRARLAEVGEISSQERQALLDAAEVEIEQTFIPAFTKLRDYLRGLESSASDEPGVGQFPGGDEFYDYVLRHWSTIEDVSAEQVHELGLAEVARLQAEMRAVAVEMGYPADISMAAIDQLIAESAILTGEALRQEYERLIAQAGQAAQDYFGLFPSAAVVVEYDPNSFTPAYYRQPPHDGSGPGRMIVNLQDSAQYLFYNTYSLTHHETIPGHHVQYALAEELDLPRFRRDLMLDVARQYFTFESFTDGWALYAGQLAWEMGLYGDDLLSNLGRLRLFLRFASDVVVDTGIHSQGWTLQEAVAYKEQTLGVPFNPRSLTKIISVPGQVCGNYLGYLKILELRQRAMDQLGEQFDIEGFHDVVLGHGPLPLEVLERLVDEWIQDLAGL